MFGLRLVQVGSILRNFTCDKANNISAIVSSKPSLAFIARAFVEIEWPKHQAYINRLCARTACQLLSKTRDKMHVVMEHAVTLSSLAADTIANIAPSIVVSCLSSHFA